MVEDTLSSSPADGFVARFDNYVADHDLDKRFHAWIHESCRLSQSFNHLALRLFVIPVSLLVLQVFHSPAVSQRESTRLHLTAVRSHDSTSYAGKAQLNNCVDSGLLFIRHLETQQAHASRLAAINIRSLCAWNADAWDALYVDVCKRD